MTDPAAALAKIAAELEAATPSFAGDVPGASGEPILQLAAADRTLALHAPTYLRALLDVARAAAASAGCAGCDPGRCVCGATELLAALARLAEVVGP